MFTNLTKAYQYLIFFGGYLKSPLLLLCRLYWGWGFIQAGLSKLNDIDTFAHSLEKMDLAIPYFQAYLVGYTEFFGGICLLLGFASRLIAIPLIFEMFIAYLVAHTDALKAVFDHPSTFVEATPFNFLLTSFFILAFGPGRFSVDYLLEKWVFHRAQAIPTHQHLPH
jgi:putative oxidoreductase